MHNAFRMIVNWSPPATAKSIVCDGALIPGTIYGMVLPGNQDHGQAIVVASVDDMLTIRNLAGAPVPLLQPAGGTRINVTASLAVMTPSLIS